MFGVLLTYHTYNDIINDGRDSAAVNLEAVKHITPPFCGLLSPFALGVAA
jgi:hypothetical protein